jgi:hypothetical protein
MTKYPFKRVTPDEIRRIFNDNCYTYRLQAGELKRNKEKSDHVKSRKAPVPVCSLSQIVAYFDNDGNCIVRVHQYRLRDGSLGGSGKPDPKWLLHNGEVYIPEL